MPIPLPTYGNFGGNGENDAWYWADRYAEEMGLPYPVSRDPANLPFVLEAVQYFGRMPVDDYDWAYFFHDVGSIPGEMLSNILNHLAMAQNIWDALLSEVYQLDLYHIFYGPASALFMTLVGIPFEIAREAYDMISGFVGDVITGVGDVISDLGGFFNDFGNAVGDFFTGVGDFLGDVISGLGDLIGDFVDAVRDIIEGIGRGIGEMMDTIFPVVLDLDGDGVELISVADSEVAAGGARLGWVSGDDGILAFDANRNGLVDGLAEISLVSLAQGATTDLEGLAGLDSNGDGVIDASDEGYADLLIWRDLNGDGQSSADEVMTLAQAGIASIALSLNGDRFHSQGNSVFNTTSFVRADGSSGSTWDVGLAAVAELVVEQISDDVTMMVAPGGFSLIEVTGADGAVVDVSGGEAGAFVRGGGGDDQLDVRLDGSVAVIAGDGNDVVITGATADVLLGGDGDDRLSGGGGGDRLWGGAGRDVFVFQDSNTFTAGGEDRIMDFQSGEDFIDLSDLDANLLVEGRQTLAWTEEFSGMAGQARLTWDSSEGVTRFELDRNGDGQTDFAFLIHAEVAPDADWIL